jgi:hypothetical protein
MRAAALALALALLPAALPAQDAPGVAFAKFGPLPAWADPDLDTAPRLLDVTFGEPLPVAAVEGEFLRVTHPDAGEVWLRRSHVQEADAPRFVQPGPGFPVTNRQRLRFWDSHADMAEFLAQGGKGGASAAYEEIILGRAGPRLPVRMTDNMEVQGRRTVRAAAVMLPLSRAAHDAFEALKGAQGARFDVFLLVDASGDAAPFTRTGVTALIEDLERRLRGSPNTYDLTISYFGAGVRATRPRRERLGGDGSADPGRFPVARPGPQPEPVLALLHAATAALDRDAAGRIVLLWTGGDIAPEHSLPDTGGRVTLENPGLLLPPDTQLLLAEAAPEPSSGLARLARGLGVEPVAFGRAQVTELGLALSRALQARDDEPVDDAVLRTTCADGGATLCIAPMGATTTSRLPAPPPAAGLPEAAGAEWYSVLLWVVVDGLILEEEAP